MSQISRLIARAVAAGAVLGLVGAAAALDTARASDASMLVAQATVTPATPSTTEAKPKPKHVAHITRVEARINELKARLKITADEEALWNDVAQTMRDNAKTVEDLSRQRYKEARTMTAVEDLQSFQTITQAHADGLKKLVAAFGALYNAMPDAQKKNADAVFRSFEHRPGPRHKAPAKPAPQAAPKSQ
ncbi:MAG TPA: Spy/CpxP family protein refolding chaperone [Alphaproteobacteria bacterium]|nr:Spy/CpxP family protein refolding chaperone [Alphaproteobacteria bacterium]